MSLRRAALVFAAILGACLPYTAIAEIVIGVAGPMSGNLQVLGDEMHAGAEAAVADVNAAGGVTGQQLRLEVVDDGCDAKTADAVANQLAGAGAVMVAGHLCLTASLAAASVYAGKNIVQISPATTFPKYTDERAGPGTFRVAGRDDQQPAVAAALLVGSFVGAKVAFVDDKSPYGKGLADAVRQAFNDAGGKEVLTQEIDPGAKDYAELVSILNAAGIGVVYFGGSWPEAALLARGMKDRAMTATLVGGDALANDEYAKLAGAAADGTLFTFMPDPRRDPANTALVQAFRDKGVEPDGFVLYTYSAVEAWAEAANLAGSVDFDKVVAALGSGRFQTALGPIAFDEKGDVTSSGFVVYEWRGGKYAYRK